MQAIPAERAFVDRRELDEQEAKIWGRGSGDSERRGTRVVLAAVAILVTVLALVWLVLCLGEFTWSMHHWPVHSPGGSARSRMLMPSIRAPVSVPGRWALPGANTT